MSTTAQQRLDLLFNSSNNIDRTSGGTVLPRDPSVGINVGIKALNSSVNIQSSNIFYSNGQKPYLAYSNKVVDIDSNRLPLITKEWYKKLVLLYKDMMTAYVRNLIKTRQSPPTSLDWVHSQFRAKINNPDPLVIPSIALNTLNLTEGVDVILTPRLSLSARERIDSILKLGQLSPEGGSLIAETSGGVGLRVDSIQFHSKNVTFLDILTQEYLPLQHPTLGRVSLGTFNNSYILTLFKDALHNSIRSLDVTYDADVYDWMLKYSRSRGISNMSPEADLKWMEPRELGKLPVLLGEIKIDLNYDFLKSRTTSALTSSISTGQSLQNNTVRGIDSTGAISITNLAYAENQPQTNEFTNISGLNAINIRPDNFRGLGGSGQKALIKTIIIHRGSRQAAGNIPFITGLQSGAVRTAGRNISFGGRGVHSNWKNGNDNACYLNIARLETNPTKYMFYIDFFINASQEYVYKGWGFRGGSSVDFIPFESIRLSNFGTHKLIDPATNKWTDIDLDRLTLYLHYITPRLLRQSGVNLISYTPETAENYMHTMVLSDHPLSLGSIAGVTKVNDLAKPRTVGFVVGAETATIYGCNPFSEKSFATQPQLNSIARFLGAEIGSQVELMIYPVGLANSVPANFGFRLHPSDPPSPAANDLMVYVHMKKYVPARNVVIYTTSQPTPTPTSTAPRRIVPVNPPSSTRGRDPTPTRTPTQTNLPVLTPVVSNPFGNMPAKSSSRFSTRRNTVRFDISVGPLPLGTAYPYTSYFYDLQPGESDYNGYLVSGQNVKTHTPIRDPWTDRRSATRRPSVPTTGRISLFSRIENGQTYYRASLNISYTNTGIEPSATNPVSFKLLLYRAVTQQLSTGSQTVVDSRTPIAIGEATIVPEGVDLNSIPPTPTRRDDPIYVNVTVTEPDSKYRSIQAVRSGFFTENKSLSFLSSNIPYLNSIARYLGAETGDVVRLMIRSSSLSPYTMESISQPQTINKVTAQATSLYGAELFAVSISTEAQAIAPTPTPTPTITPSITTTNTQTPTSTNSPTPTTTITLTGTATSTPTQTPTSTPTPTNTQTPTSTVSLTPTNTSTPTPTITPTNSPFYEATQTPTPTNTSTITVTPTTTPTQTPSTSPTNTPTPSISVSPSPTVTQTPTNTPTASITRTPTPTSTITVTPTNTSTVTPTATPTLTLTSTLTSTPTSSQTPTPTTTVSLSASSTATPTPTTTITETPLLAISPTPTPTPTSTITTTPTTTPTLTESPTPTATPSQTQTLTSTPTNTVTPTPTITDSPTPTPTNTLTATVTPTVTRTATATPSITPSHSPTPSTSASNIDTAVQWGVDSSAEIIVNINANKSCQCDNTGI